MEIQVRINEEGALHNQRYAFTNRFTLVSELLQNARRAGASKIQLDYDLTTRILHVADDGHGINDFQALLAFHESGWPEQTQQRERPFGIGFSKCLYAASRCIVRSRGWFVDFQTEAALRRTPIQVRRDPGEPVLGTQVELHEVDLGGLDDRIDSLCKGFGVDVIYNGRRLVRPYAEDHLETISTPVGAMHLVGVRTGHIAPTILGFLQGFRVFGPSDFSPVHVNVVHLDPQVFQARLPDRDRLIDQDDPISRVYAELRHQWRAILQYAKGKLPPREFVDRYYGAMKAFDCRDLINDLDELPREVCAPIVGYPIQLYSGEHDSLLDLDAPPPTRAAIENGQSVLVAMDDVGGDTAAAWMYAHARRFLVINGHQQLPEGHWGHTQVRHLDSASIQVEPVGPLTSTYFDGRWIGVKVVLCDTVRLTVSGDVVDITDDGVYHEDVLYIPAGEASGKPVRQVSSYTDDMERFLQEELQADLAALADLIHQLRSVDPRATLQSLLDPLHLEKYPVLRDKTFRLAVSGNAHRVELID